jgi:hypothetical protein
MMNLALYKHISNYRKMVISHKNHYKLTALVAKRVNDLRQIKASASMAVESTTSRGGFTTRSGKKC